MTTLTPPQAPRATAATRRRVPVWVWVLAGFALLSFARVVTGANEVNSSGTLREAINASVPIILAGIAGLWSERAGVVNIGLEGMMILGTIGAGIVGYEMGPWMGVVGGIVFGAIGGLIHAVATVVFGVDHIVSGVAITIIAGGVAAFLADTWFSGVPGGGRIQSPPLDSPGSLTIGPIADAARTIENKHWFLISDAASVVGAVTRNLSWLSILAVVIVLLTAWVLWRTTFGLRLRSVGESPVAAETLGVNVYRYKFVAVIASGAIAGLGGAFIVLAWAGLYLNGNTRGIGYIGLAAMIFGNWRPGLLVAGAALFGYTDALQLRAGGEAVHSLLLILAIVLIGYGAWQLYRGSRRPGIVTLVIGVLVGLWFLLSDSVPGDFIRMTPYVLTLAVLALAGAHLRMPAADGQVYRKGSAG